MSAAKSNTFRRLIRISLRTKTSRKRAGEIRHVCGRVLACGPLERIGTRWTFKMISRPDIESAEVWLMLIIRDVACIDYIHDDHCMPDTLCPKRTRPIAVKSITRKPL